MVEPATAEAENPFEKLCQNEPSLTKRFCEKMNLIADTKKSVLQSVRNEINKDLQSDYFKVISDSIRSQFAATLWLAGENPINAGDALVGAISRSSKSCSGPSKKALTAIVTDLTGMNAAKELKLNGLSKAEQSAARRILQKRTVIAFLEAQRIQNLLATGKVRDDEKITLKKRLYAIREAYPMIDDSEAAEPLQKVLRKAYGAPYDFNGSSSHPEIQQIVVADPVKGYKKINISSDKSQGNEGLINQILRRPMPAAVTAELNRMMNAKLTTNFQSIGTFCQLDACQTMAISPRMAYQTITRLPAKDQRAAHEAACACGLTIKAHKPVSETMKNVFDGLALGGFLVCPFTFGVGCGVGAAATVSSVSSSAANMYSAKKEMSRMAPLIYTVKALPGLDEEDKENMAGARDKAAETVKSEAVDIGLSVVVPAVVKPVKGAYKLIKAKKDLPPAKK